MNLFDPRDIETRYAEFKREQPDVFPLFCKLARQARDRGFAHYSATTIVEQIRWHFEVTHGKTFKCNDHFRAPMARELERLDPTFAGFFRQRTRRSA